MHEVDPSYLGYWSRNEIAAFLNSLLEQETIGTNAFAEIGRTTNSRIADLILESELDQCSICILLQNEISKRGAAVAPPHERPTNERCAQSSFAQAVAYARFAQNELVQMIEKAVPNVLDSELNSNLVTMLQFHRKQIERLETLLP
jgi:hypothetical protein